MNIIKDAFEKNPQLFAMVQPRSVRDMYDKDLTGSPVWLADKWREETELVLTALSPYRNRMVVKGINEPAMQHLPFMLAFEQRRLDHAEDLGIKLACFSLPVGIMEPEDFAFLYPVLERMNQRGDVLDFHAYYAIRPDHPDHYKWLPFRYRRWYTDYFEPNGLTNIPFWIGETGSEEFGNIPGSGPWRQIMGQTSQYMGHLKYLDGEYAKDPYVMAALTFLWGYWPPIPVDRWQYYDIGQFSDDYGGYIRSKN